MTEEEKKQEIEEAKERVAKAFKKETPKNSVKKGLNAVIEKADKEEKERKEQAKQQSKEDKKLAAAEKKAAEAKKKAEEAKKKADLNPDDKKAKKDAEKAAKAAEKAAKDLARMKKKTAKSLNETAKDINKNDKKMKDAGMSPEDIKKTKGKEDDKTKDDKNKKKTPEEKKHEVEEKKKERAAKLAHAELPGGLKIREEGSQYVLVAPNGAKKDITAIVEAYKNTNNQIDEENKKREADDKPQMLPNLDERKTAMGEATGERTTTLINESAPEVSNPENPEAKFPEISEDAGKAIANELASFAVDTKSLDNELEEANKENNNKDDKAKASKDNAYIRAAKANARTH